ncbi:hypothetical protein G9A89_014882 [Geosiphon pyriformis]|nr:hypothetical protein G9A89_014882 [Geosiphon pyriformis]
MGDCSGKLDLDIQLVLVEIVQDHKELVEMFKIWAGYKGEFDSKELLVLLVVVNSNSGVVIECTGLVLCTEEVDFEG